MNHIEKQQRYYIIYIAIFIFFLLVFYRIPLIHDSWAGQVYNNSDNFIQWVQKEIHGYFTLNGRIFAQIFVGFFERNKVMLNFFNAVFVTLLIWIILKTLDREKNFFFIALTWALLLLASANIRTEVYFYATMIYLIPAILFFLFIWFYIYCNRAEGLLNSKNFCILCILGVLNSGWIEHSAFAFVIVTAIYLVYDTVKNRKLNFKFIIFELLCGVTFCIMMLSPGLRLQRQISPRGSMLELIKVNLGYTVQGIIYEHKLIFFIFICASLIVIHQKSSNKNFLFYIYQALLSIYLVVFGLNIIHDIIGIYLPDIILLQANIIWKYAILWQITGILLIILLSIPVLYNSQKCELLFSYLTGVFSVAPTIITPNFGYRICFFAFVIIVFLIVGIVADINFEKRGIITSLYIFIYAILFIKIDSYSILVANINNIQKEREQLIELVKNEQRLGTWDYKKTLILPMFTPEQLYACASPEAYYDPIHHQCFKEFYNLNPETLVLFSNNNNELRVSISDGTVAFEIIPENAKTHYKYMYYILNNGQIVWESEQTINKKKEAAISMFENCTYYFKCNMIDEQGNITEVFSANVYSIE